MKIRHWEASGTRSKLLNLFDMPSCQNFNRMFPKMPKDVVNYDILLTKSAHSLEIEYTN